MSGTLRDALGRTVPLDPEPRRILALVPSVTRCLFDLGVGARVVGRTDYCAAPREEVQTLPRVGGPKTVSVERVLALAPDLVLADAEENQRDPIAELERRGLRVYVALPRTLERVAGFLRDLAALVRRPQARQWADELTRASASAPGPPVPVACLVWNSPYMAAAPDTLPHAVLTAAGGSNVVARQGDRRYPEIAAAALARARPRVILLPDDPYPFSATDAAELEASVPGATAVCIPGEWVSWYGSRMVESLQGLTRSLDPFR
ncbi:MAG TPA: helical backbone metal receptor [Deferrisomatales bacterium]|nr:helical backbone metal receptor [Deferrisomatales bacterium]